MDVQSLLKSTRLHDDGDGNLVAWNSQTDIPFTPKRIFSVCGMTSKSVRGKHAHLKCHQFLYMAQGNCRIKMNDGFRWSEISLENPNAGLHIPAMTWVEIDSFSKHAVMVVLASELYDATDYIRKFENFIKLVRSLV